MEEKRESEGKIDNSPSYMERKELARAAGDDKESDAEEELIIDPREWVREAMRQGLSPREILLPLLSPDCLPSQGVDDATLWRVLLSLFMTSDPRNKLPKYNTVEHVVQLISEARNIMVLTGAGISVSCGIPDFRSPQGLYATLHREFPELPDPQAMFDIQYFNDDPRPFFRFCKEIYPGQFTPSPSHYFIATLEQRGKLLRHYTQNIDTLEHTAGISRVVYCHGSFATASCCHCKFRVNCDAIREDVMNQEVPMCPKCMQEEKEGGVKSGKDEEEGSEVRREGEKRKKTGKREEMAEMREEEDEEEEEIAGVMKPDIVFFGEGLPDEFHQALEEDKDKVDLLIVMGSSLKVRPVSLIPSVLDQSVPQVLINREPLPHMTFDIQLLGYSDTIVRELCRRLGPEWVESVGVASDNSEVSFTSPEEQTHLFPGAVWNPKMAGPSSSDAATLDSEHAISEPSDSESHQNGHTPTTLNFEPTSNPLGKHAAPNPVPESSASVSSSTSHIVSEDHDSPPSDSATPPTSPVRVATVDQPHIATMPPNKRLKLHHHL